MRIATTRVIMMITSNRLIISSAVYPVTFMSAEVLLYGSAQHPFVRLVTWACFVNVRMTSNLVMDTLIQSPGISFYFGSLFQYNHIGHENGNITYLISPTGTWLAP